MDEPEREPGHESAPRPGGAAADALAGDALRESEERYRHLFEAESDAILVVRSDTAEFVDANRAALAMYGYTQEEFLRLTSSDVSAEPEKTRRAITERELKIPLRWHRKKDGTVFPVEITLSFFEVRGRGHHVVVIRDLTEQRRMEAALKEAEEQFRQAQKMEAIGQLAGGVAHDFNNILAGVLLNLGLLQLEPLMDPEMKASLKELEKDVLRGTALTRQLLAFSRRQAMEPRAVDLKASLKGVLEMLRRLLGEPIELVLQAEDGLPPAEVDPGMLEQVVINLCVNARDAMPQGGRLTLSIEAVEFGEGGGAASKEARPGGFIRLSVSDTGCGMDEPVVRHLFEPFFTTKGVGKGTGLGLATVHGIVKQHRGWLEVETAPGRGSTFRAYLPRYDGKSSFPDDAREEPPWVGSGETILVVEDESRLRAGAMDVLQRHGYRAIGAVDGPDGLRQWELHRDRIDLVVTDMVMPGGMTGRELVERLRRERPGLGAILCTGYSDDTNLPVDAQDLNMPLLRKPFNMPSLLAAVRQGLGRKGSGC